MTNRIIYIAGAISNGHSATPRGIYQNVKTAQFYYEQLIKKGYSPILPHLSYYAWLDMKEDVDWKTWIEMDLDYVEASIGLLRIPGESKGADREVEFAKKIGKPVYFNLNEIPNLERDYGRI